MAAKSTPQRNKTSRRRHRRTEEELIEALHRKIAMLEQKKALRAMKADPVLRLAAKLARSLQKAGEQFQQGGRGDLAAAARSAAAQFSLGSSKS